MRSSIIADAIIFSRQEDLRKLASEQLRLKGVSNILLSSTEAECLDHLKRFPKAFLLIDWETAQSSAVRILSHPKQKNSGRTTLLIATKVTDHLIATAAEYGVSQVYTDAMNAKNLGARLTGMLLNETVPNDIKKGLLEAFEARDKGDQKKAVAGLEELLKKHPTHMRIKAELAEMAIDMEDWQKAQELLSSIPPLTPPYLRALTLQARCHMKEGNLNQALEVLSTAKAFNPYDPERLAAMGNLFMHLDQPEEAKASFDEALAVDPDHHDARIGKGQCLLLDGEINEALALIKEITNKSELASLFNVSAVIAMRNGHHEHGMQLYQSAIKALGRNNRILSRLYFNMGIGYRRWSRPEKALECFSKAVELDPAFAKAKTYAAKITYVIEKKEPLGGGSINKDIGESLMTIWSQSSEDDFEEEGIDFGSELKESS